MLHFLHLGLETAKYYIGPVERVLGRGIIAEPIRYTAD